MNKVYTFHTDPGHGWLQVERSELVELGIADKISSCSYQSSVSKQKDEDVIFLEEDCDAPIFMKAMKAIGKDVTGEDKHTDSESFVRDFRPYKA